MFLPYIRSNHFARLIVTSIFATGLLFPSFAHATDFRIVVSPPSTEISIKPQEVSQKTIKITNNATTAIELKATISDFIVQDDQGTPIKVSEQASGRYLAAPWITLSRYNLTIAPQATEEIIVIVQAPTDALAGGHYAGVFFSPKQSTKPTSTGAEVVPEVGSLFAINIPGDIKYDATITSFTTSQPVYEFGPISFQASIANHSDTHISPNSQIVIKDMLGQTLSSIPLAATNIFPFTTRALTGTWDNVWGLGRYSAELTAAYGPSFATSRILYFWIMPYRLIAAIIIIILVLLALFVLINRRRKHQEDTRDTQIDSLKRRISELENK
ncbi:MAG: hypothetical protein WCL07_01150 [bacterium]